MGEIVSFESASGWFADIERVASPNFDSRPAGAAVDLVVIHAISLPPGEFGGGDIERFFQNRLDPSKHSYYPSIEGLEVSAHLLIDRRGLLKQFVSTNFRAWHCGESSFDGRGACNDYSIGIELEGSDTRPFTSAQYEMLVCVLIELLVHYPAVSGNRIVGHSDIAVGRKTDPGPCFDWRMMRNMMQEKHHRQAKGYSG